MKKSFIFYTDYEHKLKELTDRQCGILLRKIFEYERTLKHPKISDKLIRLSFDFIKNDLDRNREIYEKRSKAQQKRKHADNQPDASCAKKLASVNGNDNVNDNDNVNVNGNDSDIDLEKLKEQRQQILDSQREERFLLFWQHYPVKIAQAKARAAFYELDPSVKLLDEMISGINIAMASTHWEDQRYIPYASNFIYERRWEDSYMPITVNSSIDYNKLDSTLVSPPTYKRKER